jgi:hypothetical protein
MIIQCIRMIISTDRKEVHLFFEKEMVKAIQIYTINKITNTNID